jgi:hypothetical protein
MFTFENYTDDPPLFIRSRTVIDLLKDFRLFILFANILGYLVKVSIQVVDGEGSLDDR